MLEPKKKFESFWKSYRLKRFQKVVQSGKRLINFNFPQFSFYVAKNDLPHCQFGIGIPHKMIKKATSRNFYKRQIKNMLTKWIQEQNYSCQKDKNHYHQNLIIIMRHPYLKNDFVTNQKKLYYLLSWVLNQK